MRLLHVFSTFAPGGQQTRTVSLMNALREEFAHVVMAIDGCFDAVKRIAPDVEFRVEPPPRKGALATPAGLAGTLRRLRPDLLLTYNWGAIEAVLAARLIRACPVIHAEDGFGADEAHRPKRRRAIARRWLLGGVHATVVPSRTLLRIATRWYRLSPSRVRHIPNGVDCDRFQPRRGGEARRLLGIGDGELLLAFVGHLRPEKNLSLLLEAFARARLAGARLVLAGDGPCRRDLERQAAAAGLLDRVRFAGAVPDPRLCYDSADLFVLSSLTEQMPMALLEAMACGLPVVCTDVGDCEEMLPAGTPQVVPPGDAALLAAALRRMAESPETRASCGEANRRRALELYSQSVMVGRYRGLYQEAVRAFAGRGPRH
jgi:glycosyltransferase involved in cell wall biosynthesis